MIVVDTSVWISYFRADNSSLVRQLNEELELDRVAIAAPVWIEILNGAGKNEMDVLRKVFSALPRFYPSKAAWKTMETWSGLAKKRGQRFGFADLLIAAIASENEATLWSLDEDFQRMKKLKFVKLY